MNEKFCFFDGNHKRVKSFVTLTASTYDSVLQKQVALAILDCKHGDTENIEVFCWFFNSAFKEINGIGDRFSPPGFCTDMATANFNGLVKIYWEEILDKLKSKTANRLYKPSPPQLILKVLLHNILYQTEDLFLKGPCTMNFSFLDLDIHNSCLK